MTRFVWESSFNGLVMDERSSKIVNRVRLSTLVACETDLFWFCLSVILLRSEILSISFYRRNSISVLCIDTTAFLYSNHGCHMVGHTAFICLEDSAKPYEKQPHCSVTVQKNVLIWLHIPFQTSV